ncbi:MAG: nucleoside phosphorylase [Lentisphaerae bacterium]|nr:nucleoside phosphorylase [Lentisphaerota bacterium]
MAEQHSHGGEASLPLLNHPLDAPTAFRPEDLVGSVRSSRDKNDGSIPEICVLEFDGDLTDKLQARGELKPCDAWPCFHTTMWLWESDGLSCGIIARTIGGSYTVLIAEQLAVCGARLVIGLASAGRLDSRIHLPAIVLADEAIRDEGTSYHYLPPSETVKGTPEILPALERSLSQVGLPLHRGLVWTTDAPYRETADQMQRYADRGALAVEMQAASLFAFGQRQEYPVALVAHVTNAPDHEGEAFAKGPDDIDVTLLRAICRGATTWLGSLAGSHPGVEDGC